MVRPMNHDLFEDARWVISAIARGLNAIGGPAAELVLSRLAEQDLTMKDFVERRPVSIDVTRFFAQAIAETMMHDSVVAAALASLDGHLKWCQSSVYTDEILGEGFLQNYGWCEIIGPKGFFKGDDFLLGILMLGPNRHCKDHYHPAPELYWPLTGPTLWKQGQGEFELKQAGEIIWHPAHVAHATKSNARPLLAVWSWTRDTDTPARLVEA